MNSTTPTPQTPPPDKDYRGLFDWKANVSKSRGKTISGEEAKQIKLGSSEAGATPVNKTDTIWQKAGNYLRGMMGSKKSDASTIKQINSDSDVTGTRHEKSFFNKLFRSRSKSDGSNVSTMRTESPEEIAQLEQARTNRQYRFYIGSHLKEAVAVLQSPISGIKNPNLKSSLPPHGPLSSFSQSPKEAKDVINQINKNTGRTADDLHYNITNVGQGNAFKEMDDKEVLKNAEAILKIIEPYKDQLNERGAREFQKHIDSIKSHMEYIKDSMKPSPTVDNTNA